MGKPLTRRTSIVGSLAAIGFARAASAKVWRIALVTSGRGDFVLDVIRTSLESAGYKEGNNLIIDFRQASGHYGSKTLAGRTADHI